jgi:hypothetical protein
MNGKITNEEEALFVADQIRKGNLIGEKKEDAFKALERWGSSTKLEAAKAGISGMGFDPDAMTDFDTSTLTPDQVGGLSQLLGQRTRHQQELADYERGLETTPTDETVSPGLWAGMLGAPVDVMSMAMRPFGYNPDPGEAVFSSEWWADKIGDEGTDTFQQRVGEDWQRRGDMFEDIKEATLSGDQSYLEGVAQTIGKVGAGAAFDFIGEGLVSAGRGLSTATPDVIEAPITDAAVGAAHAFLETDIGQAGLQSIIGGAEKWTAFKEENPRIARNIEAVVNVGLLLTPVKGKPKAPIPSTPVKPTNKGWIPDLDRAGGRLIESGETKAATQRSTYIDDLILPEATKPVREARVPRTAQRGPILQEKIYTLSPAEKAIAAEVKRVPTVSPKKTYLDNHKALDTAVSHKNSTLASLIDEHDASMSIFSLIRRGLGPAMRTLKESPLMVGDAGAQAQRILQNLWNLIGKETGIRRLNLGSKVNASQLLKVRKELDAWARSQKADVFDPASLNSISFAMKEIREGLNNSISYAVPNVAVKQTLREQHHLLNGMNNILSKAANQANTRFHELWRSLLHKMPIRSQMTQLIALGTGMGGLGAAAIGGPWVRAAAIGGAAAWAGRMVFTSPNLRIMAGEMLKGVNKLLKTTKDSRVLMELRADKALLLEVLKATEGASTEEIPDSSEEEQSP